MDRTMYTSYGLAAEVRASVSAALGRGVPGAASCGDAQLRDAAQLRAADAPAERPGRGISGCLLNQQSTLLPGRPRAQTCSARSRQGKAHSSQKVVASFGEPGEPGEWFEGSKW